MTVKRDVPYREPIMFTYLSDHGERGRALGLPVRSETLLQHLVLNVKLVISSNIHGIKMHLLFAVVKTLMLINQT
jgi:hypothetical protein